MGTILSGLFIAVITVPIAFFCLPKRTKRWIFLKTLLNDNQKPSESDLIGPGVLPHSEIVQLESNLWVISGTLPQPGPKFNRNMTIFRIPNSNKLVLHSVIRLNEKVKADLENLGEVSFVIVPNTMHRLDAPHYKKLYPEAKFLCPEIAREKVSSWVDIDETVESFVDNSTYKETGMQWLRPDGIGEHFSELLYLLQVEDQDDDASNKQALICTDFFFNIKPDDADFVTNLIGSASGFGTTSIGLVMVEDPVRVQDWIAKRFLDSGGGRSENICHIVVGHGDVVSGEEMVRLSLFSAAARMT